MADENVLHRGRSTWRVLAPPGIALPASIILYLLMLGLFLLLDPELGDPALLLVFAVGLCALLPPVVLVMIPGRVLTSRTIEAAITSRRVIVTHRRLIIRRTLFLDHSQVEGVAVRQSTVGRIFNYGTIVCTGTGGERFRTPFIAQPLEFRSKALDVIGTRE